MDCVVFSDLHAHDYATCGTMVDGVGSRLRACLDALEQVRLYVDREKVPYTFFLGDLFQSASRMDMEVLNRVYSALQRWPGQIFCLVGNHDWVNESRGVHALEVFKSSASVVDRSTLLRLDGERVLLLPFARGGWIQTIKKVPADLVLLHQGLSDVPAGPGVYLRETMSSTDMPRKAQVFLGHYHAFSRPKENVWYVGSLLQRDWSDEGVDKGFVRVRDGTVERIPIESPRFVTLHLNSEDELIRYQDFVNGNYVRLCVDFNCSASRMMEQAHALGARWSGIVGSKRRKRASSVVPSLGAPIALDQLVRNRARLSTRLKRKTLISVGMRLLEGDAASIGAK